MHITHVAKPACVADSVKQERPETVTIHGFVSVRASPLPGRERCIPLPAKR
jgi:hypothetical protein